MGSWLILETPRLGKGPTSGELCRRQMCTASATEACFTYQNIRATLFRQSPLRRDDPREGVYFGDYALTSLETSAVSP
jgi:hypothetical protein